MLFTQKKKRKNNALYDLKNLNIIALLHTILGKLSFIATIPNKTKLKNIGFTITYNYSPKKYFVIVSWWEYFVKSR